MFGQTRKTNVRRWDLDSLGLFFPGMAAPHDFRAYYFLAASGGLPHNETTFAELAKLKGYTTALIGLCNMIFHVYSASAKMTAKTAQRSLFSLS